MIYKNTKKIHALSVLLGYFILFLMRGYISNILMQILLDNKNLVITSNFLLDICLYIILFVIVVKLVHEFVHGTVIKIFGGTVKYKFKGFFVSAEEISEKEMNRTEFLIVLTAPLLVISLLTAAFSIWQIKLIFLINIFMSIEDIIKTLYLLKAKSESKIIMKDYGFDIVNLT
ncbi:DUF3267 domain-containing protein [Clostridium sp. 19966]|uniref:DUF3267 domain-containing protein n=1 Tax=Clostridium sp. 19966 TaxID=2768166 RepID=UPI0028DE1999|nr:DUF3267 domain-containing protein [Clostridium sp. 19966]MDT8718749.1 DUF3267 domain-containing protein [Clostridium sp. 19966]